MFQFYLQGNLKLLNYQREGLDGGRWLGKLTSLLRDEEEKTSRWWHLHQEMIIARNVDGDIWLVGDNFNKMIQ